MPTWLTPKTEVGAVEVCTHKPKVNASPAQQGRPEARRTLRWPPPSRGRPQPPGQDVARLRGASGRLEPVQLVPELARHRCRFGGADLRLAVSGHTGTPLGANRVGME